MYPSTNPEKIHNRKVEVNLLQLFGYYERVHDIKLFRESLEPITREARITALEKDILEFASEFEIGLQLHHYRITPKMLAEAYLDSL